MNIDSHINTSGSSCLSIFFSPQFNPCMWMAIMSHIGYIVPLYMWTHIIMIINGLVTRQLIIKPIFVQLTDDTCIYSQYFDFAHLKWKTMEVSKLWKPWGIPNKVLGWRTNITPCFCQELLMKNSIAWCLPYLMLFTLQTKSDARLSYQSYSTHYRKNGYVYKYIPH